jgi:hypothetical protein
VRKNRVVKALAFMILAAFSSASLGRRDHEK